jgi:hypothetical protein
MAVAYKTSSLRGPSSVTQDGAKRRLVSADGLRWAISANRKRSLPNHRFDIVEVWTLKERVNGKAVTAEVNQGEEQARKFCGLETPQEKETAVRRRQVDLTEWKRVPDSVINSVFEILKANNLLSK